MGQRGGVDTEGQWRLLRDYETMVALSAAPQYSLKPCTLFFDNCSQLVFDHTVVAVGRILHL